MILRRILPLFFVVLAGCAMASPAKSEIPTTAAAPEPPPDSPDDARARIAALEARIAARRAELDLPAPSPTGGATRQSAAEREEPSATPPVAQSPAEMPPAPAQRPARAAPPPPVSTPSADVESAPRARSAPRRSPRCQKVDQATAEICDASERICRLADDIGDGDAAQSCTRAREDCRNAATAANRCF